MANPISERVRIFPASGTYNNAHGSGVFSVLHAETIRLDVDGTFPQMMASGSYMRTLARIAKPTYWIAYPLKEVGYGIWEGPIYGLWGDASLIPHNTVRIHVPPISSYRLVGSGPPMTVTFSGGPPAVTRVLEFFSPDFREVTVEYDTVQDSPRVTSINTCAHLNHPPSLRCENLTFDNVFGRAGVGISQSQRRSIVPLEVAGGDSA